MAKIEVEVESSLSLFTDDQLIEEFEIRGLSESAESVQIEDFDTSELIEELSTRSLSLSQKKDVIKSLDLGDTLDDIRNKIPLRNLNDRLKIEAFIEGFDKKQE